MKPRGIILCICLFFPGGSAFAGDLLDLRLWTYALAQESQVLRDANSLIFSPLPSFAHFETLVKGGAGFLWLKAQVSLSPQEQAQDLDLLLGRINGADEVYFNGVKLGNNGRFPPAYFSEWNKYRYYQLPSLLVRDLNVILIKYYGNYEGSIDGPSLLDNRKKVSQEFALREFSSSTLNGIIAALLLLVSGYHFLIFFKRPKEGFVLIYALLTLSCAIYQSNFFLTRLPWDLGLSYLVFQKIIFITMYLSLLLVPWFLESFLNFTKIPKIRLGIKVLFAAIALGFILVPDFVTFNILRDLFRPMLFLPLVYAGGLLVWGFFNKHKETVVILFGLVPFFLGVLHDSLLIEIFKIPNIYLTGVGASAFILALLFVIAVRFVNYSLEVERVNLHLEELVKERTAELQEANEKLADLSVTDPLTQVYNRRAFDMRYEEEYGRAFRSSQFFSLFIVDIDFFKKVNDTYGHLTGDLCLKAVAGAIKKAIRRPGDFLARFGGEEFVVILPETDGQGASKVAETARELVEELNIEWEGKAVPLTISIGVVTLDPRLHTKEVQLLASADQALYQAKAAGRNRVCVKSL